MNVVKKQQRGKFRGLDNLFDTSSDDALLDRRLACGRLTFSGNSPRSPIAKKRVRMVHRSLLQSKMSKAIRLSRKAHNPPSLCVTVRPQSSYSRGRDSGKTAEHRRCCVGRFISSALLGFRIIQLLLQRGLLGCSSSARPQLCQLGQVQTKA